MDLQHQVGTMHQGYNLISYVPPSLRTKERKEAFFFTYQIDTLYLLKLKKESGTYSCPRLFLYYFLILRGNVPPHQGKLLVDSCQESIR